jgi:hypothetical protein
VRPKARSTSFASSSSASASTSLPNLECSRRLRCAPVPVGIQLPGLWDYCRDLD